MRVSLTRHWSLGPVLLLAVTAGCTGTVGEVGMMPPGGAVGGAGGSTSSVPTPDQLDRACAQNGGVLNAGVTPVRRLTREQFNNTVRDLIGAVGTPADDLSDDEKIGPFHSNAIAPITTLEVQQYGEVAKTLALSAVTNMSKISPCDLATDTGTSTTCATQFLNQVGRRAYRRPLSSAELQQYLSLYALGKQNGGAQNGFRLVVQTMLQSPYFLYLHDVGSTGAPQPGVVALSQYELASRISYFLWNTMPDEPLFTAAAAGSLTDDSVVTTHVQRMLADTRAQTTIASFHRQWLDVEDVGDQAKDPTMFPKYDSNLTDAMTQELSLFSNYVIFKGDGLLKTLLTSNMAFPQGNLFGVYGMTQPAGYTVGTPVMLDGTQRAGILTQAAFLTKWSHGDQTSPVHRGKLIRLNLMCGFIGSPPPNVDTTPPPPTPATSTRQRFAQHESDPVCATCHLLMDPIGLGLENFDPIGAYRTVDGLGAVDPAGKILNGGADLDGAFSGALELANRLAQATEVQSCVANQWFRFSLGRIESMDDACSIKDLHASFKTSGGNIRDLLTRIVLSPAFRSVRLNGG